MRPALDRRDRGRPRERAGRTKPGEWVLGFKYDDTKTSDGRGLRRRTSTGSRPIIPCWSSTGAVTPRTSMPRRSRWPASPRRRPTRPGAGSIATRRRAASPGGAAETAVGAFERLIPQGLTRDERREGVKIIAKMMTRTGVTSVHDAYGTPDDLQAYQDAREAGELAFRVYCSIGQAQIATMLAAGVRTGLGDEWVRVGLRQGHLRRLDLRAHRPPARAVRGAAERPGDPDPARGAALRDAAGRPCGRLAARRARERRRGHRHHAAGVREAAARAAPARPALPHRALHDGGRRPRGPHQGPGRHSHPVLDLRLLPRREDARVRGRASGAHVRPAELPGRGDPATRPRTTRRVPSSP